MEETVEKFSIKDNSSSSLTRLSLAKVARAHVTYLRIAGLLAFGKGRFWLAVKNVLCLHTHACYLFITSMYACSVARRETYEAARIAEFLGLVGAHSRFVILYVKRAKLLSIFGVCQKLWTELDDSERLIIREFVNKSTNMSLVYLVCGIAQFVFFLVISQLPSLTSQSSNDTQIHRSLPYDYFTDVQSTPWYELAVILQTITMWTICFTCTGVDTAAPFFIMIACGCVKSLCRRIKRLIELEDMMIKRDETWSMEKGIAACVVFHQKIIEFCKEIQDLISIFFLTQLLSTTYIMSLLGLRLIEDEVGKYKYLPVISLLLTQLFLCQWPPDMLISQSEDLAQSSYYIPATGYSDKRVSKMIYIVTIKTQQLIRFTAGGFIYLSMECFGSMITSAVSFFTVLRSIN